LAQDISAHSFSNSCCDREFAGSLGHCLELPMVMSTESVYGLQVNQAGGMAKLAKTLLNLHMCFMVVYFVHGALALANAITPELPATHAEGMPNFAHVMHGNGGIGSALLNLALSMVVFMALRTAIRGDNKGLLSGVMFCDGCCTVCNCCLGVLGVLAIFSLCALNTVHEDDACKCAGTIQLNVCSNMDKCSHCFDEAKCRLDLERLHENFPLLTTLLAAFTALACVGMCCCAFAAMTLSTAQDKMQQYSFCRAAPADVGTAVVGVPIQGTILQPSAPKLAELSSA